MRVQVSVMWCGGRLGTPDEGQDEDEAAAFFLFHVISPWRWSSRAELYGCGGGGGQTMPTTYVVMHTTRKSSYIWDTYSS